MSRPVADDGVFRHEAFLYAGTDEFVEGAAAFLRAGVEADEAALVVVSAAKIALLRDALGPDGGSVRFADMADVGRNPARIIPAWQEFLTERSAGGRPVRGIGEPIWGGRTPAELVECQHHESLLNRAFAGTPSWWLLCPYDTDTLRADVIAEARRSHPWVLEGGTHGASASYSWAAADAVFDPPLPDPGTEPEELAFAHGPLSPLRALVAKRAAAFGLDEDRAADLAVAVSELATNSIRHGGGAGVLRVWTEGDDLVCEIEDRGRFDEPLVGRRRPADHLDRGRGLWIVNQLCDLVELRSSAVGAVVRVRMSRA